MALNYDKNLLGDLLLITSVAAFFTAMALALKNPGIRDMLFDIHTVRRLLQGGHGLSGQVFSAFIFVLAGGGVIALGFPRLWISAVGGIIYGAFMGTFLSVIASLIGSSATYLAGKTFLAHVVERRAGDTLMVWRLRFQENAFWWVLYGRLFPFSNSTLMNMLCGSCVVPFISFFSASFIGFIPLAAIFATFGSGGVKGNMLQIILASALLVVSIFARRIFKGKDAPTSPSAG